MTIEQYLKYRKRGDSMEEVQDHHHLSEGTVYTLELAYQCYLKRIPLDAAIEIIKCY
ncbi:hypothetical protein [Bacillus phage SBSphiJ3]|nr:hypothetical protein [Bacillus phage SBSphiJ1]UPI12478.1 hypothetical protein [Bacillus phage SBSphiJ3]UPI12972.1 hypothetical protein [Bacillus phage SBSphiJ5]